MKEKLFFAMTLMLAASFSIGATDQNPCWDYEGPAGPEHWGELSPDYSLCKTGKNQSPINIQGAMKTQHGKLKLAFQPGRQEVVNNGHTIQINVSEGNTLWLDNEIFTLQQFHFHAPSENEIDGKQFPLEAHFVYKDKDDDLAVLALMFQEGSLNKQLVKAWQQMPRMVNQTAVLSAPVDIKALLPQRLNAYYRSSGSLTTPPCSEGVRWLILAQPVTASAGQINQFRSIIHHANNRPIQPLNGRVIVN